jgi:hypothetical protein
MEKEKFLDQILEMSTDQVQEECFRHALPVVNKHIINMQLLITFVKTEEKKMKIEAKEYA